MSEEDDELEILEAIALQTFRTAVYLTSVLCKRAVPGQGDQRGSCRDKLEKTRPHAAWQQNTKNTKGRVFLGEVVYKNP